MSYDASFNSPIVLNFNSKDRIAGTNSNFISAPVELGVNKFDSVALVQASIPKSYYNVPNNYNAFTLRELDSIGNPFNIKIMLPIGTYNKINLASKLSSVMTTASLFSVVYAVSNPLSIDPDTFHFTFTATNLGSIGGISLIFDDTSPFRQMGFEANSTNTFTVSGLSLVLESINAINLAFVLRAFIKSNIVQNSTDSILEEILSIGSFPTSSLVYYQQYDFQMNTREFNTSSSNSWQFVLVDSLDNEIDLNGISFAFSIVFYTRNSIHELHAQEIKINNEERLYKIEQEQNKLREQFKPDDKLTTVNGFQINDINRNKFEPIFPVQPTSIGLSYQNEPEIIFRK